MIFQFQVTTRAHRSSCYIPILLPIQAAAAYSSILRPSLFLILGRHSTLSTCRCRFLARRRKSLVLSPEFAEVEIPLETYLLADAIVSHRSRDAGMNREPLDAFATHVHHNSSSMHERTRSRSTSPSHVPPSFISFNDLSLAMRF